MNQQSRNRNVYQKINLRPSENEDKFLNNEGYIDQNKIINNMRILILNPNRLRHNS